jgi:hypothetical protein
MSDEKPKDLDSDVSIETLQKLACSIAELLLGDLEQAQKVACDVISTIEAKLKTARENPLDQTKALTSKEDLEELVHTLVYQFSLRRLAGVTSSPIQ